MKKNKIHTWTNSDVTLNIVFGYCGSGKSTYLCSLARKGLKRGLKVYSNIPIKGCYMFNPINDLGRYNLNDSPDDCLILWDEAGVSANNRQWKNFPKEAIAFLNQHRHYHCQIFIFSQTYNNIDISLRNLCQDVHFIRRGIFGFSTITILSRCIDIINGEITDSYQPLKFKHLLFRPLYYKYFDSYVQNVPMLKKTFPLCLDNSGRCKHRGLRFVRPYSPLKSHRFRCLSPIRTLSVAPI